MTIRMVYSCDFCGDEEENPKEADYLSVPIGVTPVTKHICRHCTNAIDTARGRRV